MLAIQIGNGSELGMELIISVFRTGNSMDSFLIQYFIIKKDISVINDILCM